MDKDGCSSSGVWTIFSDVSLDEFGSFSLLLEFNSSGIIRCVGLFLF